MDRYGLEQIAAAISYIEAHLGERLDLSAVAGAAGYSRYYLHRQFTGAVGMTPHDYIRRRRLTEAARLLAGSDRPVLEIALSSGWESQQAFASVFRAFYKQTPGQYRKNGIFYPLQLGFTLNMAPSIPGANGWIAACAVPADIPDWMNFAGLVIGGLPGFAARQHREQLEYCIARRQAVLIRDGTVIAGAAGFSVQTGEISFLSVHPQYLRRGVDGALLRFILARLPAGQEVSITTFREGDRADTGQRAEYERLGFAGAELLTEFGYPTQRLVLPPERRRHAE